MSRRPDPEQEKRKVVLAAPPPKSLTPEMRRLITEEKAHELRRKAESELQDKLRVEAEDAYLEEARQKVLEENVPAAVKRRLVIDLPPEAPYLLTNGSAVYYPDAEYEVSKEVYDDLSWRMWVAWVNEAHRLDDKTANQYRRKLNVKISKDGTTHDRFG